MLARENLALMKRARCSTAAQRLQVYEQSQICDTCEWYVFYNSIVLQDTAGSRVTSCLEVGCFSIALFYSNLLQDESKVQHILNNTLNMLIIDGIIDGCNQRTSSHR